MWDKKQEAYSVSWGLGKKTVQNAASASALQLPRWYLTSLTMANTSTTISEWLATISLCSDHQISPAPSHGASFSSSAAIAWFQHLALKCLEGFCLCKTLKSISFGIRALIPPLEYCINSELPWVQEFTALVNLFWKSQTWFRNNSVHCDRNKNSSLIKDTNKSDFSP